MKSADFFNKIYIYPLPVDMRKQVNGLSHIVEASKLDLFSKNLFVFRSKSRKLIKALYWAETGFCLWAMRLEKDKFPWPKGNEQLEITSEQLNWLLQGINYSKFKPHKSSTCSRFS